jgi:hypothetical protein
MTLLDEMRKLIKSRDYVSFVELSRLEGAKGECAFHFNKKEIGKVFLWGNLSAEFCDAWEHMIENDEMHMVPASFMVYLVDGAGWDMPLVKSVRVHKKPHWLPVCFRPGKAPVVTKPRKRKAA